MKNVYSVIWHANHVLQYLKYNPTIDEYIKIFCQSKKKKSKKNKKKYFANHVSWYLKPNSTTDEYLHNIDLLHLYHTTSGTLIAQLVVHEIGNLRLGHW